MRPPLLGLGNPLPPASKKRKKIGVAGAVASPKSEAAICEAEAEPEAPFLVRMMEQREKELEKGYHKKRKKKRKKRGVDGKREKAFSAACSTGLSSKDRINLMKRKGWTGARPPPPSRNGMAYAVPASAVLIDNIPGQWRSKDLRNHFSAWVEAGAFKMFHYRHRPSRRPMEKTVVPAYAVRKATPPRPSCCCLALVRRDWCKAFVRAFDSKPWISSTGDELLTLCYVRPVANSKTAVAKAGEQKTRFLSKRERREQALKQAMELGEYEVG